MIPNERKAHLKAVGLPSDAEMIRRTRVFVLRAGLTSGELADMAALNPNSLRVYLSGNYDRHRSAESNTLNVRAALKEVMDRYEIKHTSPAEGKHYETKEYGEVRRSMWSALDRATAFLVDGPPGTQKSWTFRRVVDEINRSGRGRAVYVYASYGMSPQSFLIEACLEAGIPSRGSKLQLLRKLSFFLGHGRTLLAVDEAQNLDVAGLAVLRQLLDQPPYFGVVLGGSHDLSVRFRDWRMEQWRSRLRRTHLLSGLSAKEAEHILLGELGRMSASDIRETVADAKAEAAREGKKFSYISARNLFFAIEDARNAIREEEASHG